MPRSSSSRSSSPIKSTSIRPTTAAAAPVPVVGSTLGNSIKEGFGLGIGSSIGHRIVGAVLGPPTVAMAAPVATAGKCKEFESLKESLTNCLTTRTSSDCKQHFTALEACLKG